MLKYQNLYFYLTKLPDFNWNDLKFVLAVARAGSYAAAGRRLGVNERTVARRIDTLEACLQARLFDRGDSGILPTPAGEQALAAAERIESGSSELARQIGGADQVVGGRVRLTAVPMLINRVLIPAAHQLARDHPQLELELIAESRDLSLTRREADLALRLARPQREMRLLTRRLGKLDYAVYARVEAAVDSAPWIGYEDGMQHLPQARWIADQIRASTAESGRIAVNDIEGVLAALRAGLGKSLLPTLIGDAADDLSRLDDRISLQREIWLLVHPELRRLARIRAVIHWLEATLTVSRPEGSG